MDEAAPQAAGGMSAGEVNTALGTLRLVYPDEYAFDYDTTDGPEHAWRVIKGARLDSMLTAPTPQALAGLIENGAKPVRTAADEALEALRFDWGGFYMIGYDEVRGWWAARHGGHGRIGGGLLTADGPDGLRSAMAEDFGPVKA